MTEPRMTYYALLHRAQNLSAAWAFLYDEAVVENHIPRKQLFILPTSYRSFRVIRKITPWTIYKARYSRLSKHEWKYGTNGRGKGGLIESTEKVRKWLDKHEPIGVV